MSGPGSQAERYEWLRTPGRRRGYGARAGERPSGRLQGSRCVMADTLTAADRCDRCGAQAYHRIEFTASELLFCAHHYREHKDRLPQTEPAAASGADGE